MGKKGTPGAQAPEILELKKENEQLKLRVAELEEQLKEMDRYRLSAYGLMSELFRLRRWMEIQEDQLKDYKERTAKAERGIRNLFKWMDVNIEIEGVPT